MTKFNYEIRINFTYIFSMAFFAGIAYFIYLFSLKNIDYIALKYGRKLYVSPETSTSFYSFVAFIMVIALLLAILETIKTKIWPATVKVNKLGVLVPKKTNSKKTIMINYSQMSSINITDEEIIINYDKNMTSLIKRNFDDEYKFNIFSNTVYSNYYAYRKATNKNYKNEDNHHTNILKGKI